MLVEAHLTEAYLHHALMNLPKAKAALTASRSAASSIYVTPLQQAELDEVSGILHCEETDYKTAFSYFLEAFDAYDQHDEDSAREMRKDIKEAATGASSSSSSLEAPSPLPLVGHVTGTSIITSVSSSSPNAAGSKAVTALRYMVLCKVLQGKADEVNAIMTAKYGQKYGTHEKLLSMLDVAAAAKQSSLQMFEQAVEKHRHLLAADTLISHHLELLHESMLEANLLKVLRPYSRVELTHVASVMHLPADRVERKLGQMIIDGILAGVLDQGSGHLILHDNQGNDKAFSLALEVVANLGTVVEALNKRAVNLHREGREVKKSAAEEEAADKAKKADKASNSDGKKDGEKKESK